MNEIDNVSTLDEADEAYDQVEPTLFNIADTLEETLGLHFLPEQFETSNPLEDPTGDGDTYPLEVLIGVIETGGEPLTVHVRYTLTGEVKNIAVWNDGSKEDVFDSVDGLIAEYQDQ